MTLVLDPDPPVLRWYSTAGTHKVEGWVVHGPSWLEALEIDVGGLQRFTSIGYVLQNGGTCVGSTISQATPGVLECLEDAVQLSPEHNAMCVRVARALLSECPRAQHMLLCETGFFADMPEEAALYALPVELRTAGIRRYGGQGLLHSWVWRRSQRRLAHQRPRLISVDLGNETSLSAIRDGRAVETSLGFTPVEGIPSMTSCGDIDPTVALQLSAHGLSLAETCDLLGCQSGFSGLAGRDVSLLDISRDDPRSELTEVRDLLVYRLQMQIGAFVAVLGGVDAIVVASEFYPQAYDLVFEICSGLGALGAACPDVPAGSAAWQQLSEGDSGVLMAGIPYRRPAMLLESLADYRNDCAGELAGGGMGSA